jgi:protein transport protein SEC24
MPAEAGTIGEQGVVLPPALPLTSERLERHGLFLIEDGQTIFLWVGRDAVPQLVQDVFDLPNYESLRGGKVRFSSAARRYKLTFLFLRFIGDSASP